MLNPNFEVYKRLKSLFLFSHGTNDAELQSDYTNSPLHSLVRSESQLPRPRSSHVMVFDAFCGIKAVFLVADATK